MADDFDLEGARKAGYTDDQIVDYLGKSRDFDVAGARASGYDNSKILGYLAPPKPPPEPDPGYIGEAWRGLKHGVMVDVPSQVGETAQFVGRDLGMESLTALGDKITKWAQGNENPGNVESQTGKDNPEWYSPRGNIYEAAQNTPMSLGPGLAGAGAGAAIGSVVPGVGTALGALVGYGVGSIAALPLFYGSQGEQTYQKVKKAQLEQGANPEDAEREAMYAGRLSGGVESVFEAGQDIIPVARLAKPFAKPVAAGASNLVRQVFMPGWKQAAKTVGGIEAGEVSTEMAQQALESEIEGQHGAGPGATWEDTSSVIMPTALMSLIPGAAGAGAHHMKVRADAIALADPATDPQTRAKIALGAASVLHQESPDTARAWAKYAADRIQAGEGIDIAGDELYHGHAAHAADPLANIAAATTLDETLAAANAAVDAPAGTQGEPAFDFSTTFPEPLPEAGIAPEQVQPAHAEVADVLRGALDRNEPEAYARALETYSQGFGPDAAGELDRAVRSGTLAETAAPEQNATDAVPTRDDEGPVGQPVVPEVAGTPATEISPASVATPIRGPQDVPAAPTPASVRADGDVPAQRAVPDQTAQGVTPQFEDFQLARTGEVKTFRSAKMAALYQSQRSNRVPGNMSPRQTEDGWVLSRPVRVRTDAQKANDRRLAAERANVDPSRDSLTRIMGKLGGINADELLRDGVDKTTLKDLRSGVVGKPAYRMKGGLSLDAIAEMLDQYGFDVRDEHGAIDASKARDLIQQELDGTPVYTPEGHERQASLAAEQREREAQAQRENDFSEPDLQVSGYDGLSDAGKETVTQAFDDGVDAEMDRLWDGQGKAIADDDPLFGQRDLEKAEGAPARRESEGAQRREEVAPTQASPPPETVAAPEKTPAKAGVSLSSIPPGMLRKITVPVEQYHEGEGVKTVQQSGDVALKDIDEEISAYEKLLECVRAG